jgi:hypothetical protein
MGHDSACGFVVCLTVKAQHSETDTSISIINAGHRRVRVFG